MPIKLSDREKVLAAASLVLIIFYIFLNFLLAPKWDEIAKLKDKARTQRLELKVAEGKIKILEALEKAVGAAPEKSEAPREERALIVLRNLSLATAKSGLNLIAIRPMLDSGEGSRFSMSCTGSYKNLYDFLQILYNLRFLVLVDALDLTGGGTAAPILNIQMTLTAYY